MTEDELDDYFWTRLKDAKLIVALDESYELDHAIVMEWVITVGNGEKEIIMFQQTGIEEVDLDDDSSLESL